MKIRSDILRFLVHRKLEGMPPVEMREVPSYAASPDRVSRTVNTLLREGVLVAKQEERERILLEIAPTATAAALRQAYPLRAAVAASIMVVMAVSTYLATH